MFKKQTIVFDLDYVLNEKQINKFKKQNKGLFIRRLF